MQPAEKDREEDVFALKEADLGPEPVAKFEPNAVPSRTDEVGEGIEAEYLLEATAVCPHCLEDIKKVQVVRMLRARVNFVSSLPRRGQLLVCPKCRVTLAGALGGLL